MAEGRRLHGDGAENLQDYVEERATYGTDSDEFAEANERLQQELADLQSAGQEQAQPQAQPNTEALIDEAQLPADQMDLRQGSDREAGAGSQVDFDKLPPDAEARSRVTKGLNNQTGGMGNA
jgi:hypothetical protein